MLSSFAGAEALEIIVLLKDLSEAGLKKLESNIKHLEGRVNTVNTGGFSKATSKIKADAEAAAGHGTKKGVGGLISGFLGVPGPIAIAGAALLGFAALTEAVLPVYEQAERQEKALSTAMKDHGESLDKLRPRVEAAITDGEKYAFNSTQTTDAIIRLTSAGMKFADIETALPHIMDLARAKHLDLGEAARLYTLALMGNTRGLKDLGIVLPKTTTSVLSLKDAKAKAKIAADQLSIATGHLKTLQASHKATALDLSKAHLAVEKATRANTRAQDSLKASTISSETPAQKMIDLNNKLTGAIGDQKGSITDLQREQAHLNDSWSKFSTAIGPGLEDMFTRLVRGLSKVIDALTTALDLIGKGMGVVTGPGVNLPVPMLRSPKGGTRPTGWTPGPHGAADGGWVGLRGPEVRLVGEKGAEFITRNSQLPNGSGGGLTLVINSIWPATPQQIRAIAQALDHHEHFAGMNVAASGNRG